MTDFMVELIKQKLNEIERRENVKILHCVESGSRAWGFASPNSDYDVRFIYAHSAEFYLRLEKTCDTIEWQLDETLDINGWDIQKTLKLLHGANPTLFEWNSSPIVYLTTKKWESVSAVIDKYFRQKAGLYHYFSMAKKNYNAYLTGEIVKYKKYFYVLRPLFACRWIMEHDSPPPMLFSVLADKYAGAISGEIGKLLEQKINSPKLVTGKRIDVLNDYLETELNKLEATIKALPDDEPNGYDELDKLFLDIVLN